MSHRIVRVLGSLLLVAVVAWGVPDARAGTTGKIAGRVVNEKRESVVGASVTVVGLKLGAVSDEEGRYFIIGVPAGTYSVRADMMGSAPYVVDNVSVRPDFTTQIDISLRTEAVQLGEVRVEADRPLLQKDATGTTRFLNSQDIQKLPTRGYRDAAAQQTGVVNFQRQIDNETSNSNTLIIRGGRPNETAYFVDGFSQQDPLTGTSSTAINNNAIEEVVVLTGGFAPEYGRIMSGAVNVVTREGGSKYAGAIEALTDALAGNWIGAKRSDYNIYDGSLGGPLLPHNDNVTFYVSGERRWERDRTPSFLPDVYRDQLGALGLQNGYKPNNNDAGYSFQAKLNWKLNDKMNLRVGGLGSMDRWREYLQTYLFNLDHMPRYEDRNQSYFATFNHAVSNRVYYQVGVNWFDTVRKRGDGVAFDDLLQYYRSPNPHYDTNAPIFWQAGHVYDDYMQRNSSYFGTQASVTWQRDAHHQFKFGGDFQRHALRFFESYFPTQVGGTTPNLVDYNAYGYTMVVDRDPTTGKVTNVRLVESDSGRDGIKHPKTFSLFAQDKYEREGLIVNGGLRLDYLNVDTPALANEAYPLGDPSIAGNIPDSLEAQDLVSNRTYTRISPRLGVAFPVDERTLLRFNYGQFYQQPNLQDLYVSYQFLQHKIKTGGYFVGFGNPNLKPERTTAYEVGVGRLMGTSTRLDVTMYYKDVRDLVEIATIPSNPNQFASYRNRDYATIKGVDIGFTMKPVNNVSANLSYSLSYAVGTGSVSNTQRNIAWTASQPPKQTAPLDFDQRHKLSLNMDWRLDKEKGPSWGGIHLFENMGINVLMNVASGTPYTPTAPYNEVTLAAVSTVPSGPINSRYGPWTSNIDFKATRDFRMQGLNFQGFVWVLNVLDTRNPVSVYTSTGSPNSTGWLQSADGLTYLANTAAEGVDGQQLYELAQNNPTNYSNPRIVRFGLRANF